MCYVTDDVGGEVSNCHMFDKLTARLAGCIPPTHIDTSPLSPRVKIERRTLPVHLLLSSSRQPCTPRPNFTKHAIAKHSTTSQYITRPCTSSRNSPVQPPTNVDVHPCLSTSATGLWSALPNYLYTGPWLWLSLDVER